MAKKQHYGIKFPFTIIDKEQTLLDLNQAKSYSVLSEIMHLIFTPKGQRLRNPEFGTNLIQYIFNPNDSQTWDDIVYEIKSKVKQYVPDCNINNIEVIEDDDGKTLLAKITYTVYENGVENTYNTITKI